VPDTKFDPIAKMGQNVAIHYLGNINYRRITFVESIPWFQFLDIGAIALQTGTARTNAPNLAQYDDEFAQFRWYPLEDVQVRMFLPQSQGKWTMRNIQVPLDKQVVERNPDLSMTEFFVWEDNTPWFEALNYGDYAQLGCRLVAGGFRYIGVDIKTALPAVYSAIVKGIEPCAHVWASGASSVPVS
jgi:hypothetical protein